MFKLKQKKEYKVEYSSLDLEPFKLSELPYIKTEISRFHGDINVQWKLKKEIDVLKLSKNYPTIYIHISPIQLINHLEQTISKLHFQLNQIILNYELVFDLLTTLLYIIKQLDFLKEEQVIELSIEKEIQYQLKIDPKSKNDVTYKFQSLKLFSYFILITLADLLFLWGTNTTHNEGLDINLKRHQKSAEIYFYLSKLEIIEEGEERTIIKAIKNYGELFMNLSLYHASLNSLQLTPTNGKIIVTYIIERLNNCKQIIKESSSQQTIVNLTHFFIGLLMKSECLINIKENKALDYINESKKRFKLIEKKNDIVDLEAHLQHSRYLKLKLLKINKLESLWNNETNDILDFNLPIQKPLFTINYPNLNLLYYTPSFAPEDPLPLKKSYHLQGQYY
ncbi:hypothetical protein K502DRAFT_325048 [Neoconidiobolus thromboides FSU 785]|nr:hypothetical protein K502DRAFT_325048 [Neoconidiobolus thromboides FSU 785]